MPKEILYATNNKGKVEEVSKLLKHFGIKVITPKDLGIDLDVAETGNSLEENAILKAQAALAFFDSVLSDDTGLEINALNGEPNIHIRRWKDKQTRMEDEEIIEYCLERMHGIPLENRDAQFRTVLALALPNTSQSIETFDGILSGIILEEPIKDRVPDFPFESLFYIPQWQMYMIELTRLSIEDRQGKFNHREIALQKAIARIEEIV